jgi:hypothetical protein
MIKEMIDFFIDTMQSKENLKMIPNLLPKSDSEFPKLKRRRIHCDPQPVHQSTVQMMLHIEERERL